MAEPGPPPGTGPALDRLIAEGRVRPPRRRGPLPELLRIGDGSYTLSDALDEVRGDR